MSKLQNDFTTKQQSEKLLELGMPRLSANFYYDDENEVQIVIDPEFELQSKGYFPCWSVGRLIEIAKICSQSKYALRGLFLFLEECEVYECMLQVMDYFEICNNQFDFSKLEE